MRNYMQRSACRSDVHFKDVFVGHAAILNMPESIFDLSDCQGTVNT